MTLAVIGAGYPRTGTASLKAALDQLGFGPCYHMSELFTQPDHWPVWTAAMNGTTPDWDALFAGYRSTADVPGCLFYRELAAQYPDAKVVLTTRDPDSWFTSTQNTVLGPIRASASVGPPPKFLEMMLAIGWNGSDPATHDKAAMVARMQKHNAAVVRDIPAERLLIWQTSEGWDRLCAFLGVPVPDWPFPRINSTEAFHKMAAEGTPGDFETIKRSHARQAAEQRNKT